jgi:hypothetical protein
VGIRQEWLRSTCAVLVVGSGSPLRVRTWSRPIEVETVEVIALLPVVGFRGR